MIVKVIKVKSGAGRSLGNYIVGEKQSQGRVGEYVLDAEHGAEGGEKVKFAEAHNCGDVGPGRAVGWIAAYNEQNTRSNEKSVHIIASLQKGESLSQEQWRDAEETLVSSLGMERHPRLSAVHQNTDHEHLHIWLSRIEPERHHAVHPYRENYRLQEATLGLEQRLGLEVSRHTTNWQQTHERRAEKALERQAAQQRGDPTHAQKIQQAIADRHQQVQDRQAQRQPLHFQHHQIAPYARDLSPRYADADDKLTAERRAHAKIGTELRGWHNRLGQAQDGIEQRGREMGWLRRTAHSTGLWKDKELTGHQRARDHAQGVSTTLGDALKKREKALEGPRSEYAAARAEVWPAAERAIARDWEQARAPNEQQQEQEQAAQRQKSRGWDLGR